MASHPTSLNLSFLTLFFFFKKKTFGLVYGMCIHRCHVFASVCLGTHGCECVNFACGRAQRWALGIFFTYFLHIFFDTGSIALSSSCGHIGLAVLQVPEIFLSLTPQCGPQTHPIMPTFFHECWEADSDNKETYYGLTLLHVPIILIFLANLSAYSFQISVLGQ